MNIKIGEIGNIELVDFFGTNNNKKNYAKNRKVTGSMKNTLLNRAEKICLIEDLGRGKYNIIKLHSDTYSSDLADLNFIGILGNEIYKLLIPIILNKLIAKRIDNEEKLTDSLISIYSYFGLVNKKNYNTIRYHKTEASKQLKIEHQNIIDYFNKANDLLRYYLESCLKLLEKNDLIIYNKIEMVKYKEVSVKNLPSGHRSYSQTEHRPATEEEIEYNKKILKELKEIKDKFEFKRIYQEKLIEKNIAYFYVGYNFYYINIDQSKKYLDLFHNFNVEEYSKTFYTLIESKILNFFKKKNDTNKEILKNSIFLSKYCLNYNSEELKIVLKIKSETKGDYSYNETDVFED